VADPEVERAVGLVASALMSVLLDNDAVHSLLEDLE